MLSEMWLDEVEREAARRGVVVVRVDPAELGELIAELRRTRGSRAAADVIVAAARAYIAAYDAYRSACAEGTPEAVDAHATRSRTRRHLRDVLAAYDAATEVTDGE